MDNSDGQSRHSDTFALLPPLERTWHRIHRPRAAKCVMLVGDEPTFPLLVGYYQRRGFQIVHLASLVEAHEIVSTLDCTTVIVSSSFLSATTSQWIDTQGKPVACVSERQVMEHLSRRVDLSLADAAHQGEVQVDSSASTRRLRDLGIGVVLGGLLLLPTILTAFLLWLAQQHPIVERKSYPGPHNRSVDLLRFNIPSRRQFDDQDDTSLSSVRRMSLQCVWFFQSLYLDRGFDVGHLIRGDMYLVGPRPIDCSAMESVPELVPFLQERHSVKPGLLSSASIYFQPSSTPRDQRIRLEHDLYDVRNRNHAAIFDLQMLWSGAQHVAYTWYRVLIFNTLTHSKFGKRLNICDALMSTSSIGFGSLPLPSDAAETKSIPEPTLIVGAGQNGRYVSRALRRQPGQNWWPVAFLDDDPSKIGRSMQGVPVIGTTSALATVVQREKITAIIMTISSVSDQVLHQLIATARTTNARIMIVPEIEVILENSPPVLSASASLSDFLGRLSVEPDGERCRAYLAGKCVLVTGAAGSIGQEVVRQLVHYQPARIVGLDVNETGLFELAQSLRQRMPSPLFTSIVASITDDQHIRTVFDQVRPQIVFHAAAYKHVSMMEHQPSVAIKTNTLGTYRLASLAAEADVERFVLVSTDKAVRPSSAMGATKRLAELAVADVTRSTDLSGCAVRFGNVLESRGSVVPIFEKQIAFGGPIEVTDPQMMRYFMTIPEAASLIIQAGAFGQSNVIYLLDMGPEIAIRDLAEWMIRLRGLRIDEDIEIVYTGARPGEKLRESLAHDFETAMVTDHPSIRILADSRAVDSQTGSVASLMEILDDLVRWSDEEKIRTELMRLVQIVDGF